MGLLEKIVCLEHGKMRARWYHWKMLRIKHGMISTWYVEHIERRQDMAELGWLGGSIKTRSFKQN